MFGTSFDTPDSFNHMAVTEAARLVEGNPNANILTHDPTQYQAQYARLAEMIDGTDPDISAFADNCGKLLIWYGLGDTCVSLYRTADYFDTVKQRLGASKVQTFARMVTSPSNGHDLDGVGTEPPQNFAVMDKTREKRLPRSLARSALTRPIRASSENEASPPKCISRSKKWRKASMP